MSPRHEEHQRGLLNPEAKPHTLALTCRHQAKSELVCAPFLIGSIMKEMCTHFSACINSRPRCLLLQLSTVLSTNLIKVGFAHPRPLLYRLVPALGHIMVNSA